jgi:hypothetical protein
MVKCIVCFLVGWWFGPGLLHPSLWLVFAIVAADRWLWLVAGAAITIGVFWLSMALTRQRYWHEFKARRGPHE